MPNTPLRRSLSLLFSTLLFFYTVRYTREIGLPLWLSKAFCFNMF